MKSLQILKKLIYSSWFIAILCGCGPNAQERANTMKHIKDSIELSIQHRIDSIAAAKIQAQKDSIEIRKKYSTEKTPEEYTNILCSGHWGFDINDNNNGIKFGNTGEFMRRESLAEGSLCVYRGSWSLGKFDSHYCSKTIVIITKGMNSSDYDKFDTTYWALIITPDNITLTCPSGRTMNNY